MLGSVVLDVAIGMAFVYLLLSLIATVAQEILAAFLQLRATNLLRGMRSLFSGDRLWDKDLTEAVYTHGLVRGLYSDPKMDQRMTEVGRARDAATNLSVALKNDMDAARAAAGNPENRGAASAADNAAHDLEAAKTALMPARQASPAASDAADLILASTVAADAEIQALNVWDAARAAQRGAPDDSKQQPAVDDARAAYTQAAAKAREAKGRRMVSAGALAWIVTGARLVPCAAAALDWHRAGAAHSGRLEPGAAARVYSVADFRAGPD